MTVRLLHLAACFVVMPYAGTAQDAQPRSDLMTFAQGVLPVSVETGPEQMRTGSPQAIAAIDGNAGGFGMTPKPGSAQAQVTIIYALPSLTRFDRLAVPNIGETPSPSQTFFRDIVISGAVEGPDGPYIPIAGGTLATHADPGLVTELAMEDAVPEVLWLKVLLSGGINVERDKTYFEFSELIGEGTQQPMPMSEGFTGTWKGRGVSIELLQEGAHVTGCYDKTGTLSGTVDGRVLRALGSDPAGIPSQFILIASADGAMRGLRSTNGAPFKPYDGEPAAGAVVCARPEPAPPGCGAVLHGIGFDYDSAAIRPESAVLLNALADGLRGTDAARIEIVGHSSSEGAAEYNRALSQRRAASVVAALVDMGLAADRLAALGKGEDEPIASNADEAGRSLNRRVEVHCR